MDGQVLALELPQTVDMEIVETTRHQGCIRQCTDQTGNHADRAGDSGA